MGAKIPSLLILQFHFFIPFQRVVDAILEVWPTSQINILIFGLPNSIVSIAYCVATVGGCVAHGGSASSPLGYVLYEQSFLFCRLPRCCRRCERRPKNDRIAFSLKPILDALDGVPIPFLAQQILLQEHTLCNFVLGPHFLWDGCKAKQGPSTFTKAACDIMQKQSNGMPKNPLIDFTELYIQCCSGYLS